MTHDDSWTDDELVDRPRRGRGVLAGAFVLVVLAGLYVAAAMYFGDRVPSDTRVGGVAIGGLTPDEAQSKLEKQLADEEAEPVVVAPEATDFALKVTADPGTAAAEARLVVLRRDHEEDDEGDDRDRQEHHGHPRQSTHEEQRHGEPSARYAAGR